MTCIHTGARVRLAEYDAVVICDIHVVAGAVVLRTACRMEHRAPPNPDGYQLRIGRGVWFDQEQDYGTLIAPLRSLIVPPQYLERFASEGFRDKVSIGLNAEERRVLDDYLQDGAAPWCERCLGYVGPFAVCLFADCSGPPSIERRRREAANG